MNGNLDHNDIWGYSSDKDDNTQSLTQKTHKISDSEEKDKGTPQTEDKTHKGSTFSCQNTSIIVSSWLVL